MIDRRRADLERHLEDLRKNDGWHPFQHFVIGLLPHAGYTDVRQSNPRSDFGCDAVAITPDGKRCVVAVSFQCTKAKVLKDAKRSLEDPNREDASVLLFVTNASPAQTTWTKWKPEVKKLGLELKMFSLDTILDVATRDSVWRETCARLGITGHRPGYRLIAPYDSELLRALLLLRPKEWLAKQIELREWSQLGELRNRLILGKPGAGKTTTLFVHLEANRPEKLIVVEPDLRSEKVEELLDAASGGGVIVFDDAHEKPSELRALMSALRARQRDVPSVAERYGNVRLLLTARSQEWAEIQPPFSPTELQDLHFMPRSQVVIGNLSRDQCRDLVVACVSQWGLEAQDRLLDLAAKRAAEADASPLYVLSMLAPARLQGCLRDEHLAYLPPTVLELWWMYRSRLSSVEQEVLRLVKLFAVTDAPSDPALFDSAVKSFGLNPHEITRALDTLEMALWIARPSALPICLDVQLEAIVLGSADLDRWDTFVHAYVGEAITRLYMHNGTGVYHSKTRLQRATTSGERHHALWAAEAHLNRVLALAREVEGPWQPTALNNLAVIYAELAKLAMTKEGQFSWLTKATTVVEEAARIYREMGLEGALAASLSNLSIRHAALAGLETTREGREVRLKWSAAAVEEAVRIRRMLSVPADLARSLNNLSNRYAALATLEVTREGREAWLAKAITAVDEATNKYRELGVHDELISALNTMSNRYADLARLQVTREGRGVWLKRAAALVEEAVRIARELELPARLAASLGNVASCNGALAELEVTHESRSAWLTKAAEAVEEAVRVGRELGLQSDLATSLGTYCQVLRARAKNAGELVDSLPDLRASYDAIEESVQLFRVSGNMPYFLVSLQELIVAHILLAQVSDPVDSEAAYKVCVEGREIASSMNDREKLDFFEKALTIIT